MTREADPSGSSDLNEFRVIPWHVSRRSLNPFKELRTFLQVVRAYRREKPDLVHHFALKPVIYGGLAAQLCGEIPSVNAITGLGHVFTSPTVKMRLLRSLILQCLRWVANRKQTVIIFHNQADRAFLAKAGVVPGEESVLIRGSGVNPIGFSPEPEPNCVPLAMLPSRMLWEKGVGEFVAAAKLLRERSVRARFALVGDPDPQGNPASIPLSQLRAWADSGTVEWWGYRKDMPSVYAQANVVCLPSYAEGLPKVLTEAAACGRALVATDVPGCREVVRHGDNGLLVPVRDPEALANALSILLENPDLRARMGTRGREIALQEFSEALIIRETLELYRRLLPSGWVSSGN